MKNAKEEMGAPRSPEEEDKLRQEVTEALNKAKEAGMVFDKPDEEVCQSLGILNYYLTIYLGKFLIKLRVNFLGVCRFRLV